ncbi:MAG: hypothetical protein V3R95_09545 [Dehalococcoidia bacterium]
MRSFLKRGPVLAVIAAIAVFAVGGAAFTAANTVPITSAGDGAGTVSGFTITSIVYVLNGTTPSDVDTITFTATADNSNTNNPGSMFIRPDSTGSEYYTCTRAGGIAPAHDLTCDVTPTNATSNVQLTVVAVDSLQVIIVD